MCAICQGTGYVMQDIGTATLPDWVEIPCWCNPAPTDEDYPDFDCPVVDYDVPNPWISIGF